MSGLVLSGRASTCVHMGEEELCDAVTRMASLYSKKHLLLMVGEARKLLANSLSQNSAAFVVVSRFAFVNYIALEVVL